MTSQSVTEMDFLVPGMHCGGCMRKIESGLARFDGIEEVRANLSTRRVHVRWQGADQTLESIRDAIEALGFDAAPFDPRLADDAEAVRAKTLLRAIAVSGFATANVMLLSVSVWAGLASDMEAVTRELFHWISALIALPAIAYAGRPFFGSAVRALRSGHMNMDVPISLGVLLAAGASLGETIRGAEHVYFDAAVMLLFFLLIGRYLDTAMRGKASEAARNLLALNAVAATVVGPDGRRSSVPADSLAPGMRVFVAPGMRVPADGRVLEGSSDVDTGLLTGESVPETVTPGARVFAGTLNLSGPLTLEVTAAREDTLLAEVARLIETAEQSRAGFVRLADRLARIYAPTVHILAAGTFLGWMLIGAGWHTALMTAVAVLIITCPCALALAVPVAQTVASGSLLRRGVLVKSGDALERLAAVDTVVFDKTGTLTLGEPELVNRSEIDEGDLHLAASLAAASKHPLAQAVAAAKPERRAIAELREVPGYGIEGRYRGRRLRLGRGDWVGAANTGDTGHAGPEMWLGGDEQRPVRFRFRDRLRADACEVVAALEARGIAVILISGDRRAAVAETAAAAGIADWRAECRPADKIAALDELRARGRTVAMVGDGLNDAPALRAAHVSLSPSSAADISQTAADLVFQGAALAPVEHALKTARRTRARVRENFSLAFGYNALAIPLAVAGYVTPLIAAVVMSSSSLLVTLNALRIRLGRES